MKNKILVLGVVMLAFGLANLLAYLPVSLGIALMNRPFPFEHLHNVIPQRGGTSIEIGYLAVDEAMRDPYWLAWSLALYAGIGMIAFAVWRRRTRGFDMP